MAATFKWGGRTWAAKDKAAFSMFLKRRGQNLDSWARQHADASKSVFGYRPAPRTALEAATQQADDLLAPEIAATQKESTGLIANNQGFSKALAQLLTGAGDATRAGYQSAAATEGALGKGFSDKLAADSHAEQGHVSDVLAHAGAPEAQVSEALGKTGTSGDVAYGLGGYIPATTLGREGAAFGAAADQLPALAARTGQETSRQLSQKALDAITAIHGKAPGLVNQILQQIQSNKRAQEATDLQRQYLGLSSRRTDATITGVDPVTGLPTATVKHQNQTLADRKAARAQAKADKQAAAGQKNVKARNAAFTSSREKMSGEVRRLVRPLTSQERTQWLLSHPGSSITDIPETTHPPYVHLKTQLFNEYKGLLQYASRSGRPALKRRLNLMIDEVLAAYGIKPAKKEPNTALPPETATRGPGGTGPH